MPNKFDFLVLGATGMQGRIVTRDLVEKGYSVFVSGRNKATLENLKKKYPSLKTEVGDISKDEDLEKVIKLSNPQVIINCAEGDWNLKVYKSALKNKANVIDLGSEIPVTKDQIAMDENFKQQGLIAITGCGSTPGINNVMLDYAIKQFDSIDTIEAGFAWNSNIKKFVVPFSMESIIEEFTHPAHIIENNVWLEKTPMETVEEKEFREVGLMKNFLVRHPEPYTFYHYYKNKGLKNVRYYAGFPPHSFNIICAYIEKSDPKKKGAIYFEGKGDVSLTNLTKVLEELNPSPIGYTEKENLWVTIHGTKNGKKKNIVMECIVPTLPDWPDAGCNIDTAFPASIIGQMILDKTITKSGSYAPEVIVPHEKFFEELGKKQMTVWIDRKQIN